MAALIVFTDGSQLEVDDYVGDLTVSTIGFFKVEHSSGKDVWINTANVKWVESTEPK